MDDNQPLFFIPPGMDELVMETCCSKCLAIIRKDVYGMGGADADLDYLELDLPGMTYGRET